MQSPKKTKRIGLILTYVIAIALIVSYVYILVHGIVPKDSCLEYQKYYVENVLSDWPGYGGLDYRIGDIRYFSNNHEENLINTRGTGWSDLENEGCWTVGDESYFYENIKNARGDTEYVLKLNVFQALADLVHVRINGKEIGTIEEGKEGMIMFSIPKNLLTNGFTTFELKIDSPKVSSQQSKSTDDRELGINIISFEIGEK